MKAVHSITILNPGKSCTACVQSEAAVEYDVVAPKY